MGDELGKILHASKMLALAGYRSFVQKAERTGFEPAMRDYPMLH